MRPSPRREWRTASGRRRRCGRRSRWWSWTCSSPVVDPGRRTRRGSRFAVRDRVAHPCPARIRDTGAQHGRRGGPIAPTRIGAPGATLDGVTTVGPVQGTGLTAREAEVLALIARHLTNAQIADALFISVRTVESHVTALLRKFQVPDRRSLARLAAAASGAPALGGLPVPVTAFVGRVAERAQLSAGAGRASPGHRGRSGRGRQDPAGDQRRRRAGRAAAGRGVVRRSGAGDGSRRGGRGRGRGGGRAGAAGGLAGGGTGGLAGPP